MVFRGARVALLLVILLSVPAIASARPAEPSSPLTFRRSTAAPATQDQAVEIPTYDLTIDVDTRARRLTGHMVLRLKNRTGITLQDVVLRLYPNFPRDVFGDGGNLRMEVANVRVGDVDAEFRYEAQRTAVRVPLPEAAPPEAQIRVELDWSATFMPWHRGDGSFPLPSYYPMLAAWTDGWRTDVTRFPDRVFAAAANYDATISVPEGLAVLAGGPTSVAQQAEGKTVFQTAIGPAREFAFSVGRFAAAHASHAGIAVNVYHKPGDGLDAAAQRVALHAAAALAVYGDRFGAYPYSELNFHLINSRRGFDAGVEYPSLIYLLVNGRYSSDTRFVTAHEVAHQWWYGVVGNDIYHEPWIDEGFANWSPLLVEEVFAGRAAAERVYQEQIVRLAQRSRAPCGQGIAAYGSWNAYYAAVYGRCGQFLYTLRKELGDDAFFSGLRKYYADNMHAIGTTAEVRAALEAASGRDLSDLFRQWTGR